MSQYAIIAICGLLAGAFGALTILTAIDAKRKLHDAIRRWVR